MARLARCVLAALLFIGPFAAAAGAQEEVPPRPRTVVELLKAIKSGKAQERTQALLEMTVATANLDRALPMALKTVRAPNAEEQVYATVILGKIGKAAVPSLTPLLEDEDEMVRCHALWALALIGKPAQHLGPTVLKALRDPDEDVRCKAAYALPRIGVDAAQAAPKLVAALKDEDQPTRNHAADALVQYGKPAVPALVAALKDNDIQLKVLEILERIGPEAKAALPAICALPADWPHELSMPGYGLLDSAIYNAINTLSSDAIAELASVLKGNQPMARAYATFGLSRCGEKGIAPLLSALKDPEPKVRELAAYHLTNLPLTDKQHIAAVREALLRASPMSRSVGMKALVHRDKSTLAFLRDCWKTCKGRKQVIAAGLLLDNLPEEHEYWSNVLAGKLKDADPDVRFEAAVQLVRKWDNRIDHLYTKSWASHWQPLATLAADALRDAKAPHRADLVELLAWLKHCDLGPEVTRTELRKAIAQLMPDLYKALGTKDRQLRLAALHVLQHAVAVDRKIPAGLVITDATPPDPDWDWRADVTTTLPKVAPLLKDPDPRIREAALRVVLTFGASATPYLPALVADPDWGIAYLALDALCQRSHSAMNVVPVLRQLAKKHEDDASAGLFGYLLNKFDKTDSFAYLVQTRARKDAALRQALKQASLAKITPQDTVAALKKQLASADTATAVRAAQALAAISEFLSDDDLDAVRAAVTQTLTGRLDGVATVMKTGDAKARLEAVQLVYDLGRVTNSVHYRHVTFGNDDLSKLATRIEEILRPAFADPDLQVRRAMRKFLKVERNMGPAA